MSDGSSMNLLLQPCSLVSLLVCLVFLPLSLLKSWLLLPLVSLWPLSMPNNARTTFSTLTRPNQFIPQTRSTLIIAFSHPKS
ncbi:hypothetical protein BCR42DRAFT_453930 [Absidia repens]|uniref:Uncharacterized protein n=1 Tax=Absidia repens TaxID=90262 RepID=A0A1X2IAL0_9FUNG|nr:hypothetical protein BCR42DRAFT_453930 [Absidia repens]